MAKGTLIGPSFERIAAKYKNEPKALESLTKKIINGSTSVWGAEKMPPHPNLMGGQIQEMVRWILETYSDPDKDYLSGIKGTIRTKEQAISSSKKGFLVMTASYMDHGLYNQQQNSKQTQNTLILKSD